MYTLTVVYIYIYLYTHTLILVVGYQQYEQQSGKHLTNRSKKNLNGNKLHRQRNTFRSFWLTTLACLVKHVRKITLSEYIISYYINC